MRQTVLGLLLAAVTAVAFYLIGRSRYRCPHCGRRVRWQDVNCPHCGENMKSRHRAGLPPGKSGLTRDK